MKRKKGFPYLEIEKECILKTWSDSMNDALLTPPQHLVFVYGTLRRHEINFYLMNGAVPVAGQAWTFGELYDTGNGYPAMRLSDTSRVYGELYRVDDEQLKRLDQLEDYEEGSPDNLYERIRRPVYTDRGEVEAWLYIANPAELFRLHIPSGDWKVHRILTPLSEPEANTRIDADDHAAHRSEPKLQFPLPETPDRPLYFAYGSCMDDVRFRQRGVDHLFRDVKGRGILSGYELRFTWRSSDGMGRANLHETTDEQSVVEGKVYEISAEALRYLYEREGAFKAYRPAFVDVTVDGNVYKDVLTFLVINKEPHELAPPVEYAEEILRGAKSCVSDHYYKQLQMKMEQWGIHVSR